MKNKTKALKQNCWIVVATHEVQVILRRWDLFSFRKLASLTHISRKTLAKLHPRHPDGSLRLSTLTRLYATLYFLVNHIFIPEEQEAERRWLMESQMRISTCMAVHPAVLQWAKEGK